MLKCNLVRIGVYMVKLRIEKNANFKKCPLQKRHELPPENKLTHHPLKNVEHPDKKLTSLRIILIPWETLSLSKNISLRILKKKGNPNIQEKTSLLVKFQPP